MPTPESIITRAWYEGRVWLHLLRPLAALFSLLARRRRVRQQAVAEPLPVPVLVVGNISLGGTGKTPLLITLVRGLQQAGLKPGVISRGYGGAAPFYPFPVTPATAPEHSGDEPLLIALATGCPVVVGPDRSAAARYLLDRGACDVLLSDDGLQHYRLARDLEIAVVDGSRGLGNGFCLPAGPLREPPARLREVDWVVVNGGAAAWGEWVSGLAAAPLSMSIRAQAWVAVDGSRHLPVEPAPPVFINPVAVTGIGNPQRFFASLQALGVPCECHSFPDHHPFSESDFRAWRGRSVLMTSKDAVKCRRFTRPDWWYLQVEAVLPDTFMAALVARVRALQAQKSR